ncbi:hypothetical protein GXW83_07885 [Streptacidiphilus sp. PB12-B1b]|uniref:hypothetical protein n=1 Tax=Streptacidiphilus sp. PB12-B1b TaxID=2705012 RepID=UPI0015FCAE56|nr:hypothetical protein [Streptacidiphilus sp. PB12-B1b]QMU75669.1 hypothetical protein GXW83_07885 [Streptacidiphilus sp. PB12-B1b]
MNDSTATTASGPGDRPHPLLRLLLDAADGRFPPVDGAVTVLPGLGRGIECSVAFTGHAVVATDLPEAAVRAQGPNGFGGSLAPDFLRWLAGPQGTIGEIDVVLVARGTRVPHSTSRLTLRRDVEQHPRVRYARAVRTRVEVYGDARGYVTLAQGLAGRRELSIEVDDPGSAAGAGRSLLADALALVPQGEPVFAAVSPGNARSLRAFLAAGFVPVGSETLLRPARTN